MLPCTAAECVVGVVPVAGFEWQPSIAEMQTQKQCAAVGRGSRGAGVGRTKLKDVLYVVYFHRFIFLFKQSFPLESTFSRRLNKPRTVSNNLPPHFRVYI